jgi:hypothetical protein
MIVPSTQGAVYNLKPPPSKHLRCGLNNEYIPVFVASVLVRRTVVKPPGTEDRAHDGVYTLRCAPRWLHAHEKWRLRPGFSIFPVR